MVVATNPKREHGWVVVILVALGSVWAGCDAAASGRHVAHTSSAIIGGQPAPPVTGIVEITHAQGTDTCSGTLIARELVLTAKHCVFRRSSAGDEPLAADGFRVAFGPDDGHFTTRAVIAVDWVGMPGELSVGAAVDQGIDVAVLRLASDAPTGEVAHDVVLTFSPQDQEPVQVVGYGLTDLLSGLSGLRTRGTGKLTGYDSATGIIQVSGDSICFGDSGGPVLDADTQAVIGVLGQVAAADAGRFCGAGLSFADTPENPLVRRFLSKECALVGGCGERRLGVRQDAGSAASTLVDADGAAPDGG